MPKINCQIVSFSDYEHLRQIYTGFFLLHKQGIINASQTIEKIVLGKYQETHLKVILDNKITVYYDMHDCGEILPEYLAEVDFYFKRSYSQEVVSRLAEREKVFPFGFNYQVNSGEFDKFLLQRRLLHRGSAYFKAIFRAVRALELLGRESSTLQTLEAAPNFESEPRIIFMARAWNPEKIENKAQTEFAERINHHRAECVRALRREFGTRFFGGLAIDDYSRANFKDVLLPDETVSVHQEYIKTLKNYPICVATTGLCNSNGWKLAEYVALSKAVVSERLHYEVTGDFAKGVNYLEFSTPEELVECAVELFENKTKRENMMRANRDYYLNCLRPDRIILNSLRIVLPSLV